MRRCFDLLRIIIAIKFSRQIEIWPHAGPRSLAASDAALESPGQGTGGFLVVWHDDHSQQREAFVLIIPPLVYHLWEPGDKKIAQLALLQVLYALFSRPSSFCGRRGLWFIDNTAASFHDLHRDCFLVSPLAVTSFNRYSRLVEALSRRFAFCLTSLYLMMRM